MLVAAIIPCYNASARCRRVLEDTTRFADEVVFVDDGSTDDSYAHAAVTDATILRHERNQGKGAALATGFSYLKNKQWDVVVLLDADGQHDPEDIPQLVEVLQKKNYGIVMGNRMHDVHTMPRVRRFTNRLSSWCISKVAGQHIPDSQSGFRVLRREVVEQLSIKDAGFDFETTMLIQASRCGYTIGSVPIATVYTDEVGRIPSRFKAVRDTWHVAKAIAKGIFIRS